MAVPPSVTFSTVAWLPDHSAALAATGNVPEESPDTAVTELRILRKRDKGRRFLLRFGARAR